MNVESVKSFILDVITLGYYQNNTVEDNEEEKPLQARLPPEVMVEEVDVRTRKELGEAKADSAYYKKQYEDLKAKTEGRGPDTEDRVKQEYQELRQKQQEKIVPIGEMIEQIDRVLSKDHAYYGDFVDFAFIMDKGSLKFGPIVDYNGEKYIPYSSSSIGELIHRPENFPDSLDHGVMVLMSNRQGRFEPDFSLDMTIDEPEHESIDEGEDIEIENVKDMDAEDIETGRDALTQTLKDIRDDREMNKSTLLEKQEGDNNIQK